MIVLLLATQDEARPLFDLLKAGKVLERPFETYAFSIPNARSGGLIILSGMGPERAAAATEYAIRSRGATRVINLGLCGALSTSRAPHSLHRVTQTVDGDSLLSGSACAAVATTADPRVWPDLPEARLATVGAPVFDEDRRSRLADQADIVDMEGHAVTTVCRRHSVACHLLKGVSDHADAGGRETLQRNLAAVSTRLAEQVVSGLPSLAPPLPSLAARMANFVKVEHTIFSLPLLAAGAWLGAGGRWPGLRPLLLVILAGAGARALGMAMNRILDRHIDLLNPRTAGRDLPSGRLSSAQAWTVAAIGLAVYLAACVALGPLCLRLSPIPAAVLISYSLLKRFTSLCHYGIGICLALGPLGAHVAVTGRTTVDAATVLLALFTFCWISGFDIIYALLDLKADRELGIHSLPAALGSFGAQAMAALTHLVAAAAAVVLWRLVGGGLASGVALVVTLAAFGLAYFQKIPVHVRFFPVSAIAGLGGAAIALLGGS